MTDNIFCPCNTCNNSDICIIYNTYRYIKVASCSKYVSNNAFNISTTNQIQYRDKNIDLKAFYPTKATGTTSETCQSCGNKETDIETCWNCHKLICTDCATTDASTGNILCPECYENYYEGAKIDAE